jgi:hypothetical protein
MSRYNAAFWAVMAAMLLIGAFLSYFVVNHPDASTMDEDGDGFLDGDDAFPQDPNEWFDSDGDGIGDNSDHAPYADADGDGYPDSEDAFPQDPKEWQDSDSDGLGDNGERWPMDTDGDGFADAIDFYPSEDMSIVLNVTGIGVEDETDVLDDNAEVYLVLDIDGVQEGRLDNVGEAWSCAVGSTMAVNESYRFNADDNRRYTNFEITMVDDDLVSNDIMDIDGSSRTGRTLNVTYDIVNGSWRGNDIGGVADGSLDGTSSLDDDDGMVAFDLELAPIDENRTYRWSFLGSEYSMQATVPPRAYASYTSKDVPRSYYFGYTDAEVQRFVTSGDPVIASIAAQLRNMSASAGFDEVETIDLALRFCQSIQYSYDNATMDADEYWRFPVETLYDETGDCEDTSFLFASVAEAMGYDAVILFLPGHAAVGVASGDGSGTYVSEGGVRYYYCETTSPGFELGELPYGLEGEDVDVVQVS